MRGSASRIAAQPSLKNGLIQAPALAHFCGSSCGVGKSSSQPLSTAAREITAQAGYNVSPPQVGGYFNKINCFCFTQQTLKAEDGDAILRD